MPNKDGYDSDKECFCPASSDERILVNAVHDYFNSEYEYGNYGKSILGVFFANGHHDWELSDGTPSATGNGKNEIMCAWVINNTLEKLDYPEIRFYRWFWESKEHFDPFAENFCSVSFENAGPGDIIEFKDERGNAVHWAILSSDPIETATEGEYVGWMFHSANYELGITYTPWRADAATGQLAGSPLKISAIYRPKLCYSREGWHLPAKAAAARLPQRRDPLLLRLDDLAIWTVGHDTGVLFDYDGDGFQELTGWVAPGSGLLMLDINGNGRLDDGNELFGDFTPLSNGTLAPNGFEALAQYDSNNDGKIDASDPIWSQLRIWQHDGSEYTLGPWNPIDSLVESSQDGEDAGSPPEGGG